MRAPCLLLLGCSCLLLATGCGPAPTPPGKECAAATGAGVDHSGDLSADETWTAASSPHRIASGVRLLAKVTVEPCAVIRLGDGARLTVGSSTTAGQLVTAGEVVGGVRRPVKIEALDAATPWAALVVDLKGVLDLSVTTISDGAKPAAAQNGGGSILAYGAASSGAVLTRSVRVKDVTISKSHGYGVNLQRLSAFTEDSSGLQVIDSGEGTAGQPVLVEAGAVGSLPASSSFQGNLLNEVLVVPGGSMPSDIFKNVGVPYRIAGRLLVAPPQDGAPAVLTIEAGATLKMETTSDNGLTLGITPMRQGVLVVNGTAAAPVTFTSPKAAPAAGDWKNIYFRYSPATGNRMSYAVVEYAGAPSGLQGYGCGPAENDASVILVPDTGRPADAFIQNSTVRNAAGDTGVLLGWTSDLDGPDFVSTNTFVAVPACRVSRWRNATGAACPGSVGGSPVCL